MMKMQKKHIITIAGRPGSGKSTTSKGVAARLGYQHFSSGDLFRAIGKERGIDVTQTNLVAEQEAEIDHLVDQRLRDIGANEDERVIDSRLAWHWMPNSFKVYLDLDLEVAAGRILKNMDPERLKSEPQATDVTSYAADVQKRLNSEMRRYKALYGADPSDLKNYDLVIDTAVNNSEQVIQKVIDAFHAWLQR
jgi:CMP/dCMP kinase